MPKLNVVERRPLRAALAEQIRAAIESGDLPAGANLLEVQLASDLGASRTPLREALVQLVEERYVTSEPGRGFRVAPASIEDGIQVERLVATLERLALTESQSESAAELAELDRLHSRFGKAKGALTRENLDDRFHQQLTGRCANRWTLAALEKHRGHLRRYNRIYRAAPGSHALSVDSHGQILAALHAGHRKRAASLLEKHWLGGIARAAASALDARGS